MRAAALGATLLCAALLRGAPAIEPIGEYSDMRHTAEHTYGYTVQLWRSGEAVIGLFMASAGLAGDTPTGILENVAFDPPSGSLSFSAKLTLGMAYLGNGRSQPSRDLFDFQGRLERGVLAGTLRQRDALRAAAPHLEKVRLPKQKDAPLPEAATYAEWKAQVDGILKRRGPKW